MSQDKNQVCRFFTSLFYTACQQHILYETVVDRAQCPFRWPCIPAEGAKTTCPAFRLTDTTKIRPSAD